MLLLKKEHNQFQDHGQNILLCIYIEHFFMAWSVEMMIISAMMLAEAG